MIIVDAYGHMVSDGNDLKELTDFADKIGEGGVKPTKRGTHSYYILPTNVLINKAIRNGARLISSEKMLKLIE